MARVSISEAARLTGKSRTTLHRLIRAGDLSTCSGERNAKMVDTSELLRVFGPFEQPKGEHHSGQVSEQRDTASADQSEQVIRHLKQEIEHLNTLLLSKDSHIDAGLMLSRTKTHVRREKSSEKSINGQWCPLSAICRLKTHRFRHIFHCPQYSDLSDKKSLTCETVPLSVKPL
ncbi:helix-turn-helix transcriptional regulator [Klebsiella pneumoniae]|nr:helix-turn-helix domain-containing protein [Klebsiella pneumoniae]